MFASLLCQWEKLTRELLWDFYTIHSMCSLTLLGLVALEYKMSQRESVSVDVNHRETDDLTFFF